MKTGGDGQEEVARQALQVHDAGERARAGEIVRLLFLALEEAAGSGCCSVHAWWGEDLALVIEARLPRRRLGFAFEADPGSSGWYHVDLRPGHEVMRSGPFATLDVPGLVREFVARGEAP